MNLIESAFANFWHVAMAWFSKEFSAKERRTWAVFDKHWYAAWLHSCQGVDAGSAAWTCNDDPAKIRASIRRCVDHFAEEFSRSVPFGLKACTEFSASSNENAFSACGDPAVTRILFEEQVRAHAKHGIESYFWTWRMPYGHNFERAWSLKRIAGVEENDATYPCGPEYANIKA